MSWAELEREAQRAGELSRKAVEARGLVIGDKVAWATYEYAKTDDFTPVHRVAVADGGKPETYCGEAIPEAVCRLDLSVWPDDLEECQWCRTAYASIAWRMSA